MGICQLVEHEALDAATQGFQDALTEQLGDAVTFDMQNAQNDTATCATICNGFVSAGVDLILANATASLQAAQAATADIPILGTSITEYGVALGLTDFSGTVGGNISGSSDLAPLDEQAAMILEWMPEAKTAGLLYCSAEANSQSQVDTIQTYLEDAGLTVTQYPFSDSTTCPRSASRQPAPMSCCMSPPTTRWRPTPASWTASAGPWASPFLQARKASARAAVWPPCPSATMTWATHRRDGRPDPDREADISTMPSSIPAPPRSTTRPSATSWA